jgi:CBS domain containing-hemolysin-like protein
MVPRTEIVALPHDISIDRVVETVQVHQHSRYPVFEGNLDNIVGVATAKRLLGAVAAAQQGGAPFDIRAHLSEPLFIPESMRAYALLADMKRHRTHVAIAIDEYGSTAGLVTLRDLIARIAGELPDETEAASPDLRWLPDGTIVVDGLVLLTDLERELGIQFGETEVDTIGGYIFGKLGRRPQVGDVARIDGYLLSVEEVDGLRVAQVRATRDEDAAAGAAPEPPTQQSG